jgi:hypothetical protein
VSQSSVPASRLQGAPLPSAASQQRLGGRRRAVFERQHWCGGWDAAGCGGIRYSGAYETLKMPLPPWLSHSPSGRPQAALCCTHMHRPQHRSCELSHVVRWIDIYIYTHIHLYVYISIYNGNLSCPGLLTWCCGWSWVRASCTCVASGCVPLPLYPSLPLPLPSPRH